MTQLSLLQILAMKEPPEDIDTLKEAFQLLSKIHHHRLIGWQRIQKNGLSVGPFSRDLEEAKVDALADWEIDTLRPVYDSPFNHLDLKIIQEASEILEKVGQQHTENLPENWRWPIIDELSGIASSYSSLDSEVLHFHEEQSKDFPELPLVYRSPEGDVFELATPEQIEAFTLPKDDEVVPVIILLNEGKELPESVNPVTVISKIIYTARVTGKLYKELSRHHAVKSIHLSRKIPSVHLIPGAYRTPEDNERIKQLSKQHETPSHHAASIYKKSE